MVLGFSIAFALLAGSGRAQEDEQAALKGRVMRELPDALKRLEALYSRARASGTLTEEIRSRGPDGPADPVQSTASHKIVLEISGDLRKYSQTLIFNRRLDKATHSLQDAKITQATPERSVICRGGEYSFQLRWEEDVPIISSFGQTNDEQINNKLIRVVDDILRAPCGVFPGGLYMSRILSYPSFTIRKITRTSGQRGDHLLIDFEWDARDNEHYLEGKALAEKSGKKVLNTKRMWIETSPDEGWAIQASGRTARDGSHPPIYPRQDIEYGATRDGVPIPLRVRYSDPLVPRTTVFEVEKLEFGPISASEFTLSAYGLPELEPRARRENRLAYYLLLGGVVALCVAIALRYGVNRSKKG
jgi:hypothetical protein